MNDPPAAYCCSRGDSTLNTTYKIFLDEAAVGTAQVTKSGLYYKLRCLCYLPTNDIYRIVVQNGALTCDLGPCVPLADGFGICTQVPIKRIGEGKLRFFAQLKSKKQAVKFIPVDPQKPFAYLCCLENARFAKENGVPGLMLQCDQLGIDGE